MNPRRMSQQVSAIKLLTITSRLPQFSGYKSNPWAGLLLNIALIVGIMCSAASAGITEFALSTGSHPARITAGPDGALWFTEQGTNKIGRITTSGSVSEFPTPATPLAIVTGGDGALWFTEPQVDKIGRITTTGAVTEFTLASGSQPTGITSGPDGNLWFTEFGRGLIGKMTTSGQISEYPLLSSTAGPEDITVGPDGNLWFTESNLRHIGRLTTGGVLSEFTVNFDTNFVTSGADGNLWFSEQCAADESLGTITPAGVAQVIFSPNLNFSAARLTSGPDGNIWFTQTGANILGRIALSQTTYTPDLDTVTNFLVPTANSVPADITVGPDNNLWFTESASDKIGTLAPPQVGAEQDRANPFQATEASSSSGSLALITDANSVASSNFGAVIDWGDGTSSAGTIVGSANLFTATGTHTYSSAGDYAVNVQVTDAQDALTMVVYTGVRVQDAALASAAATGLHAVEGAPINKVIGSFTDADPNGIASKYNILAIWPGALPIYYPCTDCVVVQTGSGIFNIVSSHVFTQAGNLAFQIQVVDVNSSSAPGYATSEFTANVSVQPPFTVSVSQPSPDSVSPGGSAASTVAISAASGYAGRVTLACGKILLNGFPAVNSPPTCAFNPPTVTSAQRNSTFTITTTAPTASRRHSMPYSSGRLFAAWLLLSGIAMNTGFRWGKKGLRRVSLLCVVLAALIQLAACGGANPHSGGNLGGGTPSGTYSIMVTAVDNAAVFQTVTVTLSVQ